MLPPTRPTLRTLPASTVPRPKARGSPIEKRMTASRPRAQTLERTVNQVSRETPGNPRLHREGAFDRCTGAPIAADARMARENGGLIRRGSRHSWAAGRCNDRKLLGLWSADAAISPGPDPIRSRRQAGNAKDDGLSTTVRATRRGARTPHRRSVNTLAQTGRPAASDARTSTGRCESAT